ncbi:hypothetical protein L1987_63042 [Smallanthus sonchifolius]|uniref:Uncharacterized protein n=1 Tax=Smallanthus sonchifolius TaxID=185202 RepID=A0ACB9CC22_9ASTR|nr:hypothetical protein L1987_63042 [Smallanthus sonchifolius]
MEKRKVGALWYFFAIESELRCWHTACQTHNRHSKYLYCGEGRVGDFGFLNTSCPLLERNDIKDSTNFDFGIYLDALQTRVLETRNFGQKILYCSWWGLQNLSSLGQGLKTSTFYGEILFAYFIAVTGLVLFALLIGNMQSFSNLSLRMEEMKDKRREAEDLMSYMSLPEELRQRVRRHEQYKWNITHGVELDSFVRDLPRDLKRDIKRHLCLPSLMRVPFFEQMDEHLLDAICDRLKPLLTWALDQKRQQLPFSTRTIKAVTDVQAFALVANDLLFYSQQWRTWAACYIQVAWRKYRKGKHENILKKINKRLHDALAISSETYHPKPWCFYLCV